MKWKTGIFLSFLMVTFFPFLESRAATKDSRGVQIDGIALGSKLTAFVAPSLLGQTHPIGGYVDTEGKFCPRYRLNRQAASTLVVTNPDGEIVEVEGDFLETQDGEHIEKGSDITVLLGVLGKPNYDFITPCLLRSKATNFERTLNYRYPREELLVFLDTQGKTVGAKAWDTSFHYKQVVDF